MEWTRIVILLSKWRIGNSIVMINFIKNPTAYKSSGNIDNFKSNMIKHLRLLKKINKKLPSHRPAIIILKFSTNIDTKKCFNSSSPNYETKFTSILCNKKSSSNFRSQHTDVRKQQSYSLIVNARSQKSAKQIEILRANNNNLRF